MDCWNTMLLLMFGIYGKHVVSNNIAESASSERPSFVNGDDKGSSDLSFFQDPIIYTKQFPHPVLSEFDVLCRNLKSTDPGDDIHHPAPHNQVEVPPDVVRSLEIFEDTDNKGENWNVNLLKSSSAIIEMSPLESKSSEKGIYLERAQSTGEITRDDNSLNLFFSTSDLLELIMEIISKDHNVIILHDNHPETQDDIDHLLKQELDIPLIIVDIKDNLLPEKSWMGDYNDGMDVHILIFQDIEVVNDFANALSDLVWTPSHLLLVNGNSKTNAAFLLGHPKFSHSPYLTLLQLDQRVRSQSIYQILVYESFRAGYKVIARGYLRHHQSPPKFNLLFPDRFDYFHGYHFHLSSWVDDFPYLIQGETLEDTYGMCIYMLQEIAERLNFTYKVYELPEDHLWGDLFNGSWRGMIGEVWRGERDFCVNVMSLVEDRFKAVDFSVPYFLDSDSFLIRNPLPPPRWVSIVFPFSGNTWIAVSMTLLMLPLVLLFLIKLKGTMAPDVSFIFMEITRTVLRQDASPIASYISIRIFVGMWWLMAMILSISYTGNLIAFITVPAKARPMKTLYELAHSDLTPVMVDYGNYMPSVMKSSGDETLMVLGEKLQLLPNQDYQQGFDLVEKGTHAFIEGTEYFRYMAILFQASNTYFLEEEFFPSYVGWIYPKKTAWKHKFDKYIQRFVESGLCTYWRNKLARDFKREMNLTRLQEEAAARPLSLADLQGSFTVYGFCMALSLIVGVMEITLCRKADQE